ncbi:MAG: MarR family transcriptional regulator [Acidimicrobiaceae bacterium]|nr:MarR family transcriptional regulator [Acidimicrobiaceae bacterium]
MPPPNRVPAPEWRFLTSHARALVQIAQDPTLRLRDLAQHLDITERSAFKIVNDLEKAGYLEKKRSGRRNSYEIRTDLPLMDTVPQQPSIGDVLALLVPVEHLNSAQI